MSDPCPDHYVELEQLFTSASGDVTCEGDEVFVRGIGVNRMLGVGVFAGSLILAEASGAQIAIPIIEIQDELISGGEVDLWSTDPELIETHRNKEVYPITKYLEERAIERRALEKIMDNAYALEIGVSLE